MPESEIPKWVEAAQESEPTISGPNGTEIGAQSGTVRQSGSSSSTAAAGGSFQGAGQTLGGGPPEPRVHPTPAAPSSVQRPAQPARRSHPKEAIDQLQSLGFTRDQAISALDATDGNVEYAAGLLFQG